MADTTTNVPGQAGGTDAAEGADVSRGDFLTKATIGASAVIGGMIAVPSLGMMLYPATKGTEDYRTAALGDDDEQLMFDDLPEGEFVKMVLKFPDTLPGDAYVRERVGFARRNKKGFKDGLTGKSEKLTIMSNRCVHLGCPVQEGGGQFVCPCHGGAYGSDGEKTAGPPVRPLDRFDYEIDDDGAIWILGEHSLTNDGDELDAVYGPGQHTSGIQSLFYKLQPGSFRS